MLGGFWRLIRSNYVCQIRPIKINDLRALPTKQCLSNYALQQTTHSALERIKSVKSCIAIIAEQHNFDLNECVQPVLHLRKYT